VPGLNLGVGGFGGGYAAAALPTASNLPEGGTVNQAAFGIGTSQTSEGPATAGFGTMGLGVAATVLITWLWYTLPR
jgi:hypothetical protein